MLDKKDACDYELTDLTAVVKKDAYDYELTEVTAVVKKDDNVFRKTYSYFDGLLNKYVFQDETLGTDERPIFSKSERWNIACYIIGVMCYKFGLESYNGTVKSLAVDRFTTAGFPVYQYTGYLEGLQAATQCVGSIIVGPMMRLYSVKSVLTFFLIVYAFISMIIMAVEHANGGTMPTKCISKDGLPPVCTGAIDGDWDPVGIIPIFVVSGIPFGGIELIRRVIPQKIVGANEFKLKKLDALVHVYFEIAGTCGAFFAAYVCLIMGKAYAPVITPILYVIAAFFFSRIIMPKASDILENRSLLALMITMKSACVGFGESVYKGAKIVCLDRRFIWLIWGYSLPLVMHRYIEGGVASVYAKLVLNESAYSSFINGGSNFGELLGALFVFWNLNLFKTPLPTLRWDALVLNFCWLYVVVTPSSTNTDPANTAGIMAAIMCFISAGWSAGDVSLIAFIQRQMRFVKEPGSHVDDALPCVMSFLYVLAIVIYAIINPIIGKWLDEISINGYDAAEVKTALKTASGANKTYLKALSVDILQERIDLYFYWIGGVFFSLMSILIFFNTFVPKGSWKFNPTLDEEDYVKPDEAEDKIETNKIFNESVSQEANQA